MRWKFTKYLKPEPGDSVEVITYEGNQAVGRYAAKDTWEIESYSHDLADSQIVAWKPVRLEIKK